MQLILTQNDIELALKNYVNSLLTINGDTEITVELKATRGADGSTAIIDILPATKAKTIEAPKEVPAPVTKRVVTATKAEVVKDEPPQEVEKSSDPEPSVAVSSDPEPEDEAENVPVTDEPETQDAEAEPAPEAPKKGSLFSGLKRNNN
jgi:hypothetical protein